MIVEELKAFATFVHQSCNTQNSHVRTWEFVQNTKLSEKLYAKVKYLLDHPQVCKDMGKKAYETVTGLWNAETAVERLLNLSQSLLQGQKYPQLYESGPCSKAEILKDW